MITGAIKNKVENNGCMNDRADLLKPPFDKPSNFMKLFDPSRQKQLINIINIIRDNALTLTA